MVKEGGKPLVCTLDQLRFDHMTLDANETELLQRITQCADEAAPAIRVEPIRHVYEGY